MSILRLQRVERCIIEDFLLSLFEVRVPQLSDEKLSLFPATPLQFAFTVCFEFGHVMLVTASRNHCPDKMRRKLCLANFDKGCTSFAGTCPRKDTAPIR